MEKNQLTALYQKLVEGTKNNNFKWETYNSGSEFGLFFPRSSIIISKDFDEFTNSSDVNLKILNKNGDVVEQITNDITRPPNLTPLEELYNMVRNQVLCIDETINDILDNLK